MLCLGFYSYIASILMVYLAPLLGLLRQKAGIPLCRGGGVALPLLLLFTVADARHRVRRYRPAICALQPRGLDALEGIESLSYPR